MIRTLEYLRKGGRIGLVEGMMGSLLQIKPIIFINADGIYETLAKARGYKAAVEQMIQEAVKRFGKKKIELSVVHGQAPEDAQTLLDRLKQTLNVAAFHRARQPRARRPFRARFAGHHRQYAAE